VNLAIALAMAADGHGDRTAVVDAERSLSYHRLHEVAETLAARLPDDADTVVAAGVHGTALAASLFGAAWAGRSFAPVNHRLPADRVASLARRLAPAQGVAAPPYLAPLDRELPGSWSAEDLFADTGGRGAAFVEEPVRPAVVLYTSGTAAEPKAAVVDHDNLLAYLVNTVEYGAAGTDEAVLIAVPPFHIAGVAAVLSAVWAGRRIVALDGFSPASWIDAVRAESVTHAFVVPTMLARIVEVAAPLPSLRSLAYGGARMPVPVLEQALALYPHVDFVNAYGLTETSSTIAVLGPDEHRAGNRLASVGRPVPGVEVEIVDDGHVPVPPGATGRVRIRGAQVSGRYLGDDPRAPDGWLTTGDLGHLDADGYLYIEGRSDDVVIRGGENIAPAEIEDALLRHPGVAQAAVVGVPHPEWGEQIAAAVVLHADADPPAPDDLRAHVRSLLGGLKCPDVVAVVDDLPLTATGKVVRREVRRLLSERVDIG